VLHSKWQSKAGRVPLKGDPAYTIEIMQYKEGDKGESRQ
jgi:hypothetical protein